MDGLTVFSRLSVSCRSVRRGTMTRMSSTYLSQVLWCPMMLVKCDDSRDSMKRQARMGLRGEPIARPRCC